MAKAVGYTTFKDHAYPPEIKDSSSAKLVFGERGKYSRSRKA